MPIDEDLLVMAPIAIALVLFLVMTVNIIVDFQAKRVAVEQTETALAIGQLIALNSRGVIKEVDLPRFLQVNSSEYNVAVNLTDLTSGASWLVGQSNGSAVISIPVLLEKINNATVPAKLFVRVGVK